MKDLVKELKKNRREFQIKDIIENNCNDYLGYDGVIGKKIIKNSRLLYFIDKDESFARIVLRNIIKSRLFTNFTTDEVVSVINKYYNQGKFNLVIE